MSKNLTRKGIAFGALVALGTSLIAGAPAQAAQELNLEPLAGTEYTMIEGEVFTLKAFGNNEFLNSNGSLLRFKLKNTSASADVDGVLPTLINATDPINSSNDINLTGSGTTSSTATDISDFGDSAVFGLGTSGASTMTSPSTITIDGTQNLTTGQKTTLEVTAFIDTNNNAVVDTGELVSPTRTVTWVSTADVTTAISGSAWVGDTEFSTSVTFGGVNEALLTTAGLGLVYEIASSSPSAVDENDTDLSSGWALNTAKTAWTNTKSGISALTSGQKVYAKAYFDNAGSTLDSVDLLGSVIAIAASDRTVIAGDTKSSVVAGANASNGTAGVADTTSDGATAGTASVRLNTEYTARVKAASGTVARAGVGTTATLATSATLSTSKFITVNGTKYESATALVAAEISGTTGNSGTSGSSGTTGTDGYSALTISTTGFAAGETVTATWNLQGYNVNLTATAATAVFGIYPTTGLEADYSGYDPTIAIAGSYAAKYVVADQWGVAPADNAYTVSLARAVSGAARTTAASWYKSSPVVGGKVEFAITDNGAGAGADTITAVLYGPSVDTAGDADGNDGDVKFTLNYGTAATFTPAAITVTDSQDVASATEDGDVVINGKTLANWNYYVAGSAAEPTLDPSNNIDADEVLTISGVVTNAAGVGINASPVTISAAGITFVWTDGNSKKVYSRDSITVLTTSGGSYSVAAYSDAKGGSVVFTAAAASVSKTTTVTFAQGTAKGLALSAPTVYGAGRTVDVSIKVTDANGSAVSGVAVTLKSTGAGYLNSQSGTTDANGDVNVKLITLTGDKGAAVISATATIDGVVTTKAVTVYVAAKATIVKAATSTVVIKNVKGATVKVVRGSKSATKVATSNSQKITLKGGTGTVKVYVNGVKVASK